MQTCLQRLRSFAGLGYYVGYYICYYVSNYVGLCRVLCRLLCGLLCMLLCRLLYRLLRRLLYRLLCNAIIYTSKNGRSISSLARFFSSNRTLKKNEQIAIAAIALMFLLESS